MKEQDKFFIEATGTKYGLAMFCIRNRATRTIFRFYPTYEEAEYALDILNHGDFFERERLLEGDE